MNVEVLADGPYARFDPPSGKQTAQNLKAGDVAEFPDEYAQSLIDSKLAKKTTAKATVETPEVVFRAGPEVIFQENLDSDLSLPEQAKVAIAERQAREKAAAKARAEAAAKAKDQADKKAAEAAKKAEEDNARRHSAAPWTLEGK